MIELSSEWTPPALVVEMVWRRDEPLGAGRALARRVFHPSFEGHWLINSAPMNRTLYTVLFHLGLPLIALRLWLACAQGAGLCEA
jgi:hypothetical protein